MEEQRTPTRRGLWCVIWLALLIAYPLVVPPLSRLIREGYLPIKARVVCQPVYAIAFGEAPVDDVRTAYARYYRWWNPPLPPGSY